MSNPWLSIPLEDYERHMGSPGVQQLTALAELFKRALDDCLPQSVAVLGVAGGNGLEQIDCAATKRVVAVDINQRYLDEVERRFGADRLAGLELHCQNLVEPGLNLFAVIQNLQRIAEHATALAEEVAFLTDAAYRFGTDHTVVVPRKPSHVSQAS